MMYPNFCFVHSVRLLVGVHMFGVRLLVGVHMFGVRLLVGDEGMNAFEEVFAFITQSIAASVR